MSTAVGTDAVDALRDAAAAIGLDVKTSACAASDTDLMVANPAGGHVDVAVKRMSLASAEGVRGMVADWTAQLSKGGVVGVIVADRVTRQAREMLRDAGWGWLDLRGHLHIAGQGLFIDADIPALRETPGRTEPLAGRVGLEVAVSLLLAPSQPATVRPVAAALGRAASSVSAVLSSMRAAALIDEQRRPAVPALFWELADRWRPAHVDLASLPSTGDEAVSGALRLGLENVIESSGWALGDTIAAAAYGAAVGSRSDYPPDLYVPDEGILRRATRLLGAAPDHDSRAATLRVAPVPMVCAYRVDSPDTRWPLAQPLFVALDLAQDPGRGREILDAWTPAEPAHRVW